jgi:hypothetical protein
MIAVNHRLALSNPALSSAPSKKWFSSVSSPIFACSALMSTFGVDGLALELVANTSAGCHELCGRLGDEVDQAAW